MGLWSYKSAIYNLMSNKVYGLYLEQNQSEWYSCKEIVSLCHCWKLDCVMKMAHLKTNFSGAGTVV